MWDMYYYTRSQHDETGMFTQTETACGGAIRILILHIKSRMAKIAIGVVETDGYMLPWYVYWMKFLLMRNTVRTISMIS